MDVHLLAANQSAQFQHGAPEIEASPELKERIHFSRDSD